MPGASGLVALAPILPLPKPAYGPHKPSEIRQRGQRVNSMESHCLPSPCRYIHRVHLLQSPLCCRVPQRSKGAEPACKAWPQLGLWAGSAPPGRRETLPKLCLVLLQLSLGVEKTHLPASVWCGLHGSAESKEIVGGGEQDPGPSARCPGEDSA